VLSLTFSKFSRKEEIIRWTSSKTSSPQVLLAAQVYRPKNDGVREGTER